MNETNPVVEKKPYVSPAIRQVQLISEEAVLAVCKTNNNASSNCAPVSIKCIGGSWAS